MRIRAHVFRWRVATPVVTSFGVMHDRPMLLVQAQDDDGATGWGEIWCNFPAVGAEHNTDVVPCVNQCISKVRADEPCSAGNQDVHVCVQVEQAMFHRGSTASPAATQHALRRQWW